MIGVLKIPSLFVNFRLIAREHHFPRLDDLKGFCYAFITSILNYGKKSITEI